MKYPSYAYALFLSLSVAGQVSAQCTSPPDAVNDAVSAYDESVLVDVLANDAAADGHALKVAVTGHTCAATVTVDDFDLVELVPGPITGDCTINYRVTADSGQTDTAVVNVSLIAEIFSDGFETGDDSRWSEATAR